MLRSTYAQRVQAMIEYVEEEDECRSQYLLKYFGQEESAPCGKCDVCRAAKAGPEDLPGKLKTWISAHKNYTLKQVRTAFGTADEKYLDVLRELIDRGEVPPYTE